MDRQEQVERIREAARRMVRAMGFLGGRFAGTDLSPSAVHALIEIAASAPQGGISARDLAGRLRLEKSSVSRLLARLAAQGMVEAAPAGRLRRLALTSAGQARVEEIHAFARAQVAGALDRMTPAQAAQVAEGVGLYAAALAGGPAGGPVAGPVAGPEIRQGYQPGAIGAVTALHAAHYARTAGFGCRFEAVVATGLAGFCDRLDRPQNRLWLVVQGGHIAGSLAIDGEDLGGGTAHLRWFILDDALRGRGLGGVLLDLALGFADAAGFAATRLWTFRGLDAARHLYESRGFVLEDERPGSQWGREVQEQQFLRPAGGRRP